MKDITRKKQVQYKRSAMHTYLLSMIYDGARLQKTKQ